MSNQQQLIFRKEMLQIYISLSHFYVHSYLIIEWDDITTSCSYVWKGRSVQLFSGRKGS